MRRYALWYAGALLFGIGGAMAGISTGATVVLLLATATIARGIVVASAAPPEGGPDA
jgi:hypothetical protein